MRKAIYLKKKHIVYLLFLMLILVSPVKISASSRFISVGNGLSNSSVHAFFQDKRGCMWVATDYGLNRITGNDIKIFTQSFDDKKSLPNNYITAIFEDSYDNFWIGTLNGLYKYDHTTDCFSTYLSKEYPFFSDTKVSFIVEDKNKCVWISFSNKCLLKIDGEKIKVYNTDILQKIDITAILPGKDGEIWLATKFDGVKIFYPETGLLENVKSPKSILEEKPIFSLSYNKGGNILAASLGEGLFVIDVITKEAERVIEDSNIKLAHSILRDTQNRIWIGTDGNGLWLFDEKSKSLSPCIVDNFGFDPTHGKVQSLYEDATGNIWVSYVEKGILVMPAQNDKFGVIKNNPYYGPHISDQSVVSLLADKKQHLWIGTNGSGLYRLDLSESLYKTTRHLLPQEHVITCLFQDKHDNIYIGTYLNGFYIYDPHTEKITNYSLNERKSFVNCNHITGFTEDEQGNIWISTNGGGLNMMNPKTGEFIYFRQGPEGKDNFIISDWCNTLFIDSDNVLWLGTYVGLSCMDLKTKKIRSYTSKDGYINNDVVLSFCEDDDHNIWIATNWGLNKFDKKSNKIILYTTSEGLPSNVITNFQKDNSGKLWVSSDNGIAGYSEEDDRFINYSVFNGLINNEYKSRAVTKDTNGYLYFGGTDGILWFNPNKLNLDIPIKDIFLSRFHLFNEEVNVGSVLSGNVILHHCLQETDKIILQYNQNNFSINFDALEFIIPDRIKYNYRLEGLDSDWQQPHDKTRTAIYTNVPPGSYTFIVKAYSSSNNEIIRKLKIEITPPWWLTWWAKTLYGILFLMLLFIVHKTLLAREREKQQMREKEHNELLAQSKLQFFTDISHEIRTPLTLVISPLLKLIQENKDEENKNVYEIMHRNSMRILRLVNQILDIRKIDRGRMSLSVREVDVVSFVNNILESFGPLTNNEKIKLKFTSGQLPDTVWFDIDFIDKILYNLLSNAFKFTKDNIEVVLQINADDKLEIIVKDNGSGIPAQYIDDIFKRFYQMDMKNKSGTGIGLHLTQMLVQLHHGNISINNVSEGGSAFTVTIPYHKNDYPDNEINESPAEYSTTSAKELSILFDMPSENSSEEIESKSKHQPAILIVEDNEDIRSLLKNELRTHFTIIEAENGKTGYEYATRHHPNLIITDVMMDVMNGIEMVTKLKNNNNTRQIPVIMLSAKTNIDDNISGLKAGADVYINKPFELRYLLVNIFNLLNKQNLLKAHQNIEKMVEVSELDIRSTDDRFVEKLNKIIKENISNPDLSIEYISSEIGVSRVHLHRKIKELFKMTPSVYLRNMRLDHSAVLLRSKKISISEVAYIVGFNTHQYFSNCFKDYFGVSPLEYVQKYNLK